MNQPELFANYELDDSRWKKTIYGLVAGSFVLNLIIALSLVYVPAVRDAFYIASLFSDIPTGWVDKDYDKTQIDAATVINLPPADQLQYPDGYFEFLNSDAPSLDAFTAQNMQPEIVSTDNGLPTDFINPLPTPIPAPIYTPPPPSSTSILPKLPRNKGKLPKFEDVNKGKETIPQPSPTAQTEPKKEDAAKNQTPQIPDEKDGINQRPLKDLGLKAAQLIKEKKLDLTKPVEVIVTGQLDKDGKLTEAKRDANSKGDPLAQEMVAELIAAMSDSGLLKHVNALSKGTGKRDVAFRFVNDEKNVTVQLISTVGNKEEANNVVSTINFGLAGFMLFKKGTEEGEMLQRIKLDSNEKGQVFINWEMPTTEMLDRVQKKLADLEKNKQPQSTGQSNNTNVQAAK